MKRRLLLIVAALSATTMLSACAPLALACPAIGFVYDAPVALDVSPAVLGEGTIAACIGEGCVPAPLPVDSAGHAEMPQASPYQVGHAIGIQPGTTARVVISGVDGTVLRDLEVEIPYTSAGGSCPGPVTFHPVVIS